MFMLRVAVSRHAFAARSTSSRVGNRQLPASPVCEIHVPRQGRHAHRRAAFGAPHDVSFERSSFQLKNEPPQFVSAFSFTRSAGGSFMISSKRIAEACMQRRPRSVPSSKLYVGLW